MLTKNNTAPVASSEKASAEALAEATVKIMNELVCLMAMEIDLVSEHKNNEHKDLLERKQRLTMDYRSNIKTIATEPAMMTLLSERQRSELKKAGQKLADVADRNAKILRGAITATQGLIQTIVSIVKQQVLPKTTYNNPSDIQATMGGYSPTCKPVAINQTA